MSSNQIIDLVNVINVSIQSSPQNLSVPNINTCALFSSEQPSWYNSQDYQIYTNAAAVSVDFGSGSKAFALATAFFSQQPNPLSTGGYFVIIPLQSNGAETVEAAITRTLNEVYYFGIIMDTSLDADETTFVSLAAYVETLDKMMFYASNTIANLLPGSMLDDVRAAGETSVRCLYYDDGTPLDTMKMAAAYTARALSTNFSGSNTCQTMHLKTLTTIVPDQTINQTTLDQAQAAGVDVYVSIGSLGSGSGVPCLFTSGANGFFDQIYDQFWLQFALQTAGFNYLRATNTKIPQTEVGMEGLKNQYRLVCAQGVTNGFIAPGAWTSSEVFGDPAALIRSVSDIGYYVYSQPLSQQSIADRVARKAPLCQIAIKSAGAIHSSNVIVNVNL